MPQNKNLPQKKSPGGRQARETENGNGETPE
jgi:hypothetical protein